jgi:hypothetical protein
LYATTAVINATRVLWIAGDMIHGICLGIWLLPDECYQADYFMFQMGTSGQVSCELRIHLLFIRKSATNNRAVI